MIAVTNAFKMYGNWTAVHDLSLSIEPGQCVGLLGPNGAGKTTTLRMVVGYLPPSAGRISVCGFDTVNQSQEARRVIGYLPESTPLHPEMRVIDLLKYRAGLYGLSYREARGNIEEAVKICRVTDVRTRRVGQLSKGYKQRVGLAAALVHDPKVLILDEPTSGLDPTQIRETRSLIRDLAHRRTVLVSSHILPEVEKTCDRVLIMARGRLRADGSPAELTNRGGAACVAEFKPSAGSEKALAELSQRCAGSPAVEVLADGWTRVRLTPRVAGEDLREGLARALAQGGCVVREITTVAPTLEQVFVQIIESEIASGAAA